VGRSARLELHFEQRAGRTILARSYAEPPFRIGHAFDVDGAAYVILVCASPGVFAGDRFDTRVTVGPGARVLLASQSSLQVHPGDASEPAMVSSDFHVAGDGELHCLWDPIIPFADARLIQRLDLDLAQDSRLYWSDALMSGRTSRGESWEFAALDHELRVAIGGALGYLERYRLAPSPPASVAAGPCRYDASHRWKAGTAHYAGTILVHHPDATPTLAERLHDSIAESHDVHGAVDLVESRLMVGRLLGENGAGFLRARSAVRAAVLDTLFGTPRLVARR
jgi:urease accessory protein